MTSFGNSYAEKLKKAMDAQAQDLEEINTVPQKVSALQVQQRSEKDEKKLDRKLRDTVQESTVSMSQQEQHKNFMEMERNQRLVMMQEISSIHCSGTRDKNTR
jgi:hypothetical protein